MGRDTQKYEESTLTMDAVPNWARIPYITRGYRHIGISLQECIVSAFRVHNETVNFWSHFVPFIVFVLCTPYVVLVCGRDMSTFDKVLLLLYMLAVANCLAASSCFHLFGCRSRRAALFLGLTDFKAITILIAASYTPALSFFFRYSPFWQKFYISVLAVMLVKGLVLTEVFAKRGWSKLKNSVFLVDAAWGLIPTAHFALSSGHPSEIIWFGLRRISHMYGLYLLGFVIYTSRVPERFFPGKLDVVGHSHQLWHGCVMFAAISWLNSLLAFSRIPIPS